MSGHFTVSIVDVVCRLKNPLKMRDGQGRSEIVSQNERKAEVNNMCTWLEEEIAFYDFIWKHGLGECGKCINTQLMNDFSQGGDMYEKMAAEIVKKWPNREMAMEAFEQTLKGCKDAESHTDN